MSMFRSEDMEYCRIVLPRESAWETLNELGKIDCIHQVDTDAQLSNIARPFYNQIKRCDEVEFMLSEIMAQIKKYDGIVNRCSNLKELVDDTFPKVLNSRQRAGRTYFDEIESEIVHKHNNLKDQVLNLDNITEKQKQLVEYKQVLERAQEIMGPEFFTSQQSGNGDISIDLHGKGIEEIRGDISSNLNKVCGIIDTNDTNRFQKVVFRITKGNCWIAFKEAKSDEEKRAEKSTESEESKSVFILVFPGSRSGLVYQKVTRICESFSANRFQFPHSQQEYIQKIEEIKKQIKEGRDILNMTRKSIIEFLEEFTNVKHNAGCSFIEYLKHYVAKERRIYQSMNCLRISGSVLVGFCWVPSEKMSEAQNSLSELANKYSNLPSSTLKSMQFGDQKPPTYFKLNEFKAVFQVIVDTYGVPRYKEVNPGLFTIVTFPFLFGVMFGDIGHGGLLLIFGLYLMFFKDSILKDKTSSFKDLVPARYIVTMMGFFALYCGLIYNDFLSLRLDLFGSCYKISEKNPEIAYPTDCIYPFGIDPIWGKTTNELANANSFKMKLAVIFGVLQMCFGITMKAFNSVYFRKWLDFFFEFVPQILFMGLMFGYMDYLILAKWTTSYTTFDHQIEEGKKIPSIITTLIDMALNLGGVKEETGAIISNQSAIQTVILAITLICVPLMLIPKPVITHMQNKKKNQQSQLLDHDHSQHLLLQQEDDDLARDLEKAQQKVLNSGIESSKQGGHGDHEEFGDIFVHQIIETIEFVLGSISNTASYLRLWALSLAHSQLSSVFFSKGIQSGLEDGSVPMLVIGYFVFAMVTMGVLMAMDVMECFLHALRLHWVEFQNKFYKADGYPFTPFSFVKAIEESIPSEQEEADAAKKKKQ